MQGNSLPRKKPHAPPPPTHGLSSPILHVVSPNLPPPLRSALSPISFRFLLLHRFLSSISLPRFRPSLCNLSSAPAPESDGRRGRRQARHAAAESGEWAPSGCVIVWSSRCGRPYVLNPDSPLTGIRTADAGQFPSVPPNHGLLDQVVRVGRRAGAGLAAVAYLHHWPAVREHVQYSPIEIASTYYVQNFWVSDLGQFGAFVRWIMKLCCSGIVCMSKMICLVEIMAYAIGRLGSLFCKLMLHMNGAKVHGLFPARFFRVLSVCPHELIFPPPWKFMPSWRVYIFT
jgi:hypothetical protein